MKPISVLLASLICTSALAQTGVNVPEMANCDVGFNQLLTTYDIPGGAFALSKNGKLIYSRGFGYADIQETETVKPHQMMRIASVSKPITSIAIMKMIEAGQLNLTDKVFGSSGIFASNSYFNSASVTDSRIYDITINHLLEHSGGWDRGQACIVNNATPYPWSYSHCDPIAFPLHVTHTLSESNPVSERALVKFLMQKGLNFNPGTDYAYSNIGYLTLGLVIEEISGVSYEQYVKTNILSPLGIQDMHMAKNLLADKQEREVEYIGNGYTTLSAYGTGSYVPWEYGGFNVEAMDAHGGWIASARDLVRLLGAVDQFSTAPDILSSASITSMTTPGVNSNYAKGWAVNSANNWWHTGSLDGSRTMWVRASSGYNWAILLNKRQVGSLANPLRSAVDQLGWNCLAQSSSFPTHDLFDVPASNSSGLAVSQGAANSLNVSWASGDGDNRILIASENTLVTAFPVNGTDYTANAGFGSGDQIETGQYVVYNDNGSSVDVSGLDVGKTYHFRLIDYKKNAIGGNHALYQPAAYAQGSGVVTTNLLCNGETVTVNLNNGESPTSGDDVILGTSGPDMIVAMGGNDTICGLGGDDDINGGRGNDWIDAGTGNDTVQGANDDDEIYGDTGIDALSGGPGNDTIHGEDGDDDIKGNSGNDTLYGNEGVDRISGGSGNDTIYTGTGSNVGTTQYVTGGNGNDTMYGGSDADVIRGEAGDDTIKGGAGDDKLYGGGGEDDIDGEGGNDLVRGNASNDILKGGAGNDQVDGLGGNDVMYGGAGSDTLNGSTGDDTMYGEAGDDFLHGGGGNDLLDGGGDNDDCNGAGGAGDSGVNCETETNIP